MCEYKPALQTKYMIPTDVRNWLRTVDLSHVHLYSKRTARYEVRGMWKEDPVVAKEFTQWLQS